MAKTTKKSISKTNKKSILARSFNLRSRKVQFFVTILVIAVVGGGYMTIKSFAASSVANLSNGYLTGSGNYSVVTDTSKNNARVIRLKGAGSYAITKLVPGTNIPYLSIPANTNVRMCYTAKADAPTGAFLTGYPVPNYWNGSLTNWGVPQPNTIIGTSYSSHCTYTYASGVSTRAYIQLIATTNTPINVSQLYAEY